MKFYLVPKRIIIDLENETVTMVQSKLTDLPHVTHLNFDPMNARTFLEDRPVRMKPATVLHLNAWDCVSVITAFRVISLERNGREPTLKSMLAPFLNDPADGWKVMGNLAYSRKLPGEFLHAQKLQYATNPAGWQKLQKEIYNEAR